jgi:hypothetical protein
VTRAVSDYLAQQLNGHLSALTPLFNPRAVFGDRIRGGAKIAGRDAEKAYADLTGLYEGIYRAKPFNLRKEFDSPIDLLSATPEISSSSYSYSAESGNTSKTITVTSPLNWVLSYKGLGPERLRELLARKAEVVGSDLQVCVLHFLVMHVALKKRSGTTRLLEELRFPLKFERMDEFGELEFPIISSPLSTVRPSDDVIIKSTELSGTSTFEEVLNLEGMKEMTDPLREKLTEIIKRESAEPSA